MQTDDIPHNAQADRAVNFINKLTCTEDYVGQPFRLRPWQETVVRKIFGTLNEDGTRQYKTCFLFIPRKNGKTSLAVTCGLAELFSGRRGQQIVLLAGSIKQAGIMFNMMRTMLDHPSAAYLRGLVDINLAEKRISYPGKHSFIAIHSSEAALSLGYNPSTVIFDEFLVQKNRDLWSAISSGGGTRKDWFTFIISTAGNDRSSPVYDEFERAKKIANDPSIDPSYLPVLYHASEDEASGTKWDDENLWLKCNPALGDFGNLEFLRNRAIAARELPYEERSFRQWYLNQFVDISDAAWIPATAWNNCQVDPFPDLHGEPCYGGMDLSKVNDLTAFSLIFPRGNDTFAVKSWAWIPHDTLRKHEKKDHANYLAWVKQGWLRTCPGEAIDYDWIRQELLSLAAEWKPKIVLWDRAGASYLIQQLEKETTVPMEGFGQGNLSMSQPTKEFERLVLTGRMQHDGNKCLGWCVQNTRLEVSGTELVKPSKGRSTGRIDCVVASVMALAAAMDDSFTSVYETGSLFL